MMKAKTTVSAWKLTAKGLAVGVCCAMLMGTAVAQGPGYADGTLDVTFGFGATLAVGSPPADGSTNFGKILTTDVLGNTVAAGVGNLAWTATANAISLQGTTFFSPGPPFGRGVYHNSVFGNKNGRIEWEDNAVSQTFGNIPLPNTTNTNRGTFHDAVFTNGDIGFDVTGVLGFRSSAGNWGYIEFDWVEAASEMTVLSARVQRFAGQPITFVPTVGVSTAVPEPSSLLLFTLGSTMVSRRRCGRRSN